jgi:dTDP-4-dehydrorhamnose reductase
MIVLILGGSGMLGHKLWQNFHSRFDTYATFRHAPQPYVRSGIFDESKCINGVRAEDAESVRRVIAHVRPDVVVNCIGIVKQDAAAKDPLASIAVNALFSHQLAQTCRVEGARLIHLSTDCVFSGNKGNYAESDISDASDLYGRTKYLGEVDYENTLTLRTSMIGRELAGSHGLIEWFLGHHEKAVQGFRRAVFSGFTTLALAEIIAKLIDEHPGLHGVWHVSAGPISKFDLLSLVRDIYHLKIKIEPDDTFVCDRSLNGARFWNELGSSPPTWPEMINAMHQDPTPYEEIRRT